MNILITADLHINESKRLDDTKTSLDFITEQVYKLEPDYLVVLGDIFDKRKPTPKEIQVLNKWLLKVRNYTKKEVVLLEGNHDQDNGISSLSYLLDLGVAGVSIVLPPYKLGRLYFSHEQIGGAVADNGIVLSNGTSLDQIIKENPECEIFAFGHFHKPQILKQDPLCFYAGSIIKTNFSERLDKKQLWYCSDGGNATNKISVQNRFIPTRPMYQFDIVCVKDQDTNPPWTNVDLKDSLVKIVYHGEKEVLEKINEDTIRERFKKLVKELTIVYNVQRKSIARNEKINESISDKVALEEYAKDKKLEYSEDFVKEGMKVING